MLEYLSLETFSSQVLEIEGRPESTQLEHLSDASFVGKLLVFPANVRLDWKVIASTNTLAYLASSTVAKGKSFITLTPGQPNAPASAPFQASKGASRHLS